MSRFNPLLWHKPPVILSYAVAVLSVVTALIIAKWPPLELHAAPVSLFICAVILSAWFGGTGSGLLSAILSTLAFYFYFLPPKHSLAAKSEELPRLVLFTVSVLFVGLLTAAQRSATESLRRARDDLKGTVQDLKTANEALQTESRERNRADEERERAEEKLRQAQAELAHVSRVTAMGELTASLAHEVNQPIAAAVTDANTCLRWLNRESPNLQEAREAAARIVKDATRAAEIITRIRLLFKKGVPEQQLFDINEAIQEMIVLLRTEAMRCSVSVRTELATDLPALLGDRVQLQQVVMNLMINGFDAMRAVDGTRELTIKSEPAENEGLVVSISDTGVGLLAQQADQIFNAFFTTKPNGTGMGLSISRAIVEAHGGRLWAGVNSPRGASFHFSLPGKTGG
jgi:C4-dicarboxylate-specific signal transduction histidine kinase